MSYFDEWYDQTQTRGRAGSGNIRYVERSREQMLSPGWDQYGNSLQRTRSVGHSPAPNVQIINRIDDDHHSRSPPYHGRGRSRDRYRSDDDIADEIAGLRADLRHDRNRSRSRSAYRSPSPNYGYAPAPPPPPGNAYNQNWQIDHLYRDQQDRLNYEKELSRRRSEVARLEDRIAREDEETKMKSYREQIEWKAEKSRLRAEAKAKADQEEEEDKIKKAIRDKEDRDRKNKEERDRAVKDWERKQEEEEKERKADAKRAVEAYQRKLKEEKDEKERLKMQFKLEEEEEKREEARKLKEWELKQAEKREAEKKKKKEEEDKIEAEMRKRLGGFGFQENQINVMINPEEKAKLPIGASPSNALVFNQPKYFKVHKDYLSIETLRYFKIPYDDRSEKDYIIILQEMDSSMTDVLFEHTKRHRSSQLFIEDRGRKHDPQFAWVRKKSKSRSRSRVSGERIWRVG